MRFKGEQDETKTLWFNDAMDWDEVGGVRAPLRTTVTWADEGTPWARLRTDELILNADLARYIDGEGS